MNTLTGIIGLLLLVTVVAARSWNCPRDDNFVQHCQCSRDYLFYINRQLTIKCQGLTEDTLQLVLKELKNKIVVDLVLRQVKVQKLLKEDFEDLNIFTLSIENSIVEHFEEGLIGSIKGLKNVFISRARLERVPDFTNATSLETFSINNCNIEEISPEDIAESDSIKEFSITNSDLITILDEAFYGLKALKTLILKNNYLSELPKHLSKSKDLHRVDISYNHLEELPLNVFANSSRLYSLNLNNNLIQNLTSAVEGILRQGTIVYIERNKLKCDISLCWLVKLNDESYYRTHYIYGNCRYRPTKYVYAIYFPLLHLSSSDLNCETK